MIRGTMEAVVLVMFITAVLALAGAFQ